MKNTTAHAESINQTAQDKIDGVEEKVLDTIDRARDASSKLADKAGNAEDELTRTIESATASISEYIHEKPLQAAGIAFTAGVLATLLLSRGR